MRVITSTNVDLISPFPRKELRRVYGWLHCYKSIIETDAFPDSPEAYETMMAEALPNMQTYGVIDKNNLTNHKHDSPLVGMFAFEPSSPWNCYIHLASNRRAWKGHLMDEAASAAIKDLFETNPQLLRMSGFILAENKPVRYMAKRLGWTKEALLEDWVTQHGSPKTIIHYGLTRKRWLDLTDPINQPPLEEEQFTSHEDTT